MRNRYVTAGDSDGEYATSEYGYTYNDVEIAIAKRTGAVDVLHANHHGSSHSTSAKYAEILPIKYVPLQIGVRRLTGGCAWPVTYTFRTQFFVFTPCFVP